MKSMSLLGVASSRATEPKIRMLLAPWRAQMSMMDCLCCFRKERVGMGGDSIEAVWGWVAGAIVGLAGDCFSILRCAVERSCYRGRADFGHRGQWVALKLRMD